MMFATFPSSVVPRQTRTLLQANLHRALLFPPNLAKRGLEI
jgi:hypothetical protein